MKFKAVSISGNTVCGTGIAESSELDIIDSNRKLMILFSNEVDWVDGSELSASDFVFVYADTVEVV